jgi:DNA repair exonuclease SbcCD nuclease subunit
MRICHFSDSHLGAGHDYPRRGNSGLTLREEDIIGSFIEAVDLVIAARPDICIHSGDLFHTVRPSNRIMAIAGQQLNRLAAENAIPTVIIAGNHDAPKQPHIGAALDVYEHIKNLHVAAGGRLRIFDVNKTKLFALPHALTTSVLKEELTKCKPDPRANFNILVMHGVAAGMPEFSMADLGEQELPTEMMDRFDYTALGHYHNHRRVAKHAFYAGSTERLSQAERDEQKGIVVVELEPFQIEFQPVSCRAMVSIAPINAAGKRGDELAEMIQKKVEQVGTSDKIIRVKVEGISEETLKTIPVDVISLLKQNSFMLDITFEKEKTAENEAGFGRTAIGKLDSGFIQFLETVNLAGFDRERLKTEALKYLAEEN